MQLNPTSEPVEERGTRHEPQAAQDRIAGTRPPLFSRLERFVLRTLALLVLLGAAFGAGYYYMAREADAERARLLQQQVVSQERISALEQEVADLQRSRELVNTVELDVADMFEPIREAMARLARVRMSELSNQITAELTRAAVEASASEAAGSPTGAAATSLTDGPPDAGAPSPGTPASAVVPAVPEPGKTDQVEPAASPEQSSTPSAAPVEPR